MACILIRGADLMTLSAHSAVAADGGLDRACDLLVVDGRIEALGSSCEESVARLRNEHHHVVAEVDATDRLVMPGLVNAHCHASMTLQRGAAEDMDFPQWLPRIWQIENALEPDDIHWGAALAAVEMIKTGVVAFNDMYFAMDRVAEVVRSSGMRAALGATMFDPGEGTEVGEAVSAAFEWSEEIAAEMRDAESAGGRASRLRFFLAPHSPYTCSPLLLERVVEKAHELGCGIHLHVSEDQRQVDDSIEKYGRSPVRLLDDLRVFSVPGGCVAAHTLVVDESDLEILAERGVRVPHCPITYAKLAMPMFPLAPMLERGVDVCLGSDGPASNSDMDLFAVARQTALWQKYLTGNPEELPGDQLLRMATQVGARAIGFPDSGRLEVGAAADLILIDKNAPHLQPWHSHAANLVHSVKGSDVTDTMVDGRWLMRERELQTLDEEKIVAEVAQRGEDLLRRAEG